MIITATKPTNATYVVFYELNSHLERVAQVDIPIDGASTETKTGLSISGGYVFESTSGFQVALVVGSDRLGGSAGDAWIYEKDVWVSIGLGFNLASKEAGN